MDEALKEGWRSMGRSAARRGTALKTVLTNNPNLDTFIREGYDEALETAKKPKPRQDPFGVDLFGQKLKSR